MAEVLPSHLKPSTMLIKTSCLEAGPVQQMHVNTQATASDSCKLVKGIFIEGDYTMNPNALVLWSQRLVHDCLY